MNENAGTDLTAGIPMGRDACEPSAMPPAQKTPGTKKARIICGLSVAAVWLLALFILPLPVLAALLCASAIICLYELCTMLKKKGYDLPFKSLAFATILWFTWLTLPLYAHYRAMPVYQDYGYGETAFLILLITAPVLFVIILAASLFSTLFSKIEKPMESAALTVAAFVYIPFMLSLLLPIALWPSDTATGGAPVIGMTAGVFLAFSLILVTKLSDTGGYFIGTACGKHKMCPRLSPGKSWEGTIGGYAFSLIGAGCIIAAARIWPNAECLSLVRELTANTFSVLWALLTVVVMVTVGICGDLLESLFKRQCGVKDSSALFPAMGGFFDTFDSIIFVPLTFLLMSGLGAIFNFAFFGATAS